VLLQGFSSLLSLLSLVMLGLCVFGLIDAAMRREDAFRAADKQSKPFWLIVLGLGVVINLIFGIMAFLPIIALVASIVYIVDVRPAVRQASGGGGGPRRGGSSSDGPYGPYNGGR
jgi:formate-dependent nitrite reductase membrane component NrfD